MALKGKKTGVELIAAERTRQITEEEWTPEHDDEHYQGEMAMAAACYAAPERLFRCDANEYGMAFGDPWMWDNDFDKRREYGSERKGHNHRIPDPKSYSKKERLDLLVKAGALIAAEIDRLQRI